MLISNIALELTNKDIEALINKFIDKDRLIISSVTLDNAITIKGTLPMKPISFPFSCELKIISFFGSTIKVNISSFSALNLVLPTKIKEIALNTFISLITLPGIKVSDKLILLDIKEIAKDIKLSSLEFIQCLTCNNKLYLIINNISTAKTLDEILS